MTGREIIHSKAPAIWNTIFINVFIINIMVHFCIDVMNTLSAAYADYLGAPAAIAGLVSGLFALTALIFKMISAPAIDTFNRKYLLVGAICILFLSFAGYSISKTIPMLIVSRLLTGVGLAFSTTCFLTIASDSLPSDMMGAGIGYFSLGTAACQAVAPASGLKMVDIIGYNNTFAMLAVILLIAAAVCARMKISFKRTRKFRITLDSIIAKEAIIPTVILFLLNMTFSVVNAFLVLFAKGQGINSNIGYFFTMLAITMIFTRPMIGKLADKYGTIMVMIPSMFFFAASFLIISYSGTLEMFLLAGFVSAFGYGGCQPAIMAVVMKSVSKERRGTASCTGYIGLDLGNLVGPVLAGTIAENLGYAGMWRVMILPVFIAMLAGIIFHSRIAHPGGELTEYCKE